MSNATAAVMVMFLASAPVEYEVMNVEKQVREGGSLAGRKTEIVMPQRIIRKATAERDRLKVEVTLAERALVIGGKVAGVDRTPKTASYYINSRGERLEPDAPADVAAGLQPVLPAGPVPLGHTWKTTIAPSAAFGLPIQVEHQLNSIVERQGKRCALILSRASAKGIDPATRVGASLKADSVAAYALTEGVLVESRARVDFNLKFPGGGAAGEKILRRHVERTVTRVAK
jgi:hypothetical protein